MSQHHPQRNTIKHVYTIKCKDCKSLLSKRAMRASLISDASVLLFSTDTPLCSVQLTGVDYCTCSCGCLIRDVGCLLCGNIVGYHVTQPCGYCLGCRNNGHMWMFDSCCVRAEKRMCVYGGVMRWDEIPKSEVENDSEIAIR